MAKNVLFRVQKDPKIYLFGFFFFKRPIKPLGKICQTPPKIKRIVLDFAQKIWAKICSLVPRRLISAHLLIELYCWWSYVNNFVCFYDNGSDCLLLRFGQQKYFVCAWYHFWFYMRKFSSYAWYWAVNVPQNHCTLFTQESLMLQRAE